MKTLFTVAFVTLLTATVLAQSAEPVSPVNPQFLSQQSDKQTLASSWIGQTIYNAADENIGDVHDLLINQSGSVDAIIVGLGGFLGLGEKNVAVPLKALDISTDADGNMKLVIQASREQLDAAPVFLTSF